MLRLNCFISVSRENRDEVLSAAKRLTAASLKQDGCVAYDILESATRLEELMICETWRDPKALDAHSASDVFITEVGKMRSLAKMKSDKFLF